MTEAGFSWHVYIVRCADGSLYTGIAKDVSARIGVHNAKKGAKYTRARLPVELVWQEVHSSRSLALKREMEIKKFKRADKLALIGGKS